MNLSNHFMMTWTICIARIYLEKLEIPAFHLSPSSNLQLSVCCQLSINLWSLFTPVENSDCKISEVIVLWILPLTAVQHIKGPYPHQIPIKVLIGVESHKMGSDMLFWMLNNSTNTSKLTTTDLSKSHCIIKYFPPIIFAYEMETPTNAYAIRPAAKITVSTSFHC